MLLRNRRGAIFKPIELKFNHLMFTQPRGFSAKKKEEQCQVAADRRANVQLQASE